MFIKIASAMCVISVDCGVMSEVFRKLNSVGFHQSQINDIEY